MIWAQTIQRETLLQLALTLMQLVNTNKMEYLDFQQMLSAINSSWNGFLPLRAKTKRPQMTSTT
jgi:hypothetical protein